MAKITIAGQAVILTSSLKLEDIKTVAKYKPEALALYGGDDGKDLKFQLSVGRAASVSKYGICFANATRENGFATITMDFDYDGDDIKDRVADMLGTPFASLEILEHRLVRVIEEVKNQRETLKDNINIVEE